MSNPRRKGRGRGERHPANNVPKSLWQKLVERTSGSGTRIGLPPGYETKDLPPEHGEKGRMIREKS